MQLSKIMIIIFLMLLLPGLSKAVTIEVKGCDGKSDQIEINQGIKKVAEQGGGALYLPAKIYFVDRPIDFISNVTLKGESGTKIFLINHAGWEAWEPIITGTNLQNIEICNIEFDLNSDNNLDVGSKFSDGKSWGRGFYNVAHFINCDNIKFHDNVLHDGLGDGLRTKQCSNIEFYNNVVYKLGHDGLFVIDSENVEAYNNRMTTRTNSDIRFWNTKHIRIHDNVLDAQLDGLGGNPLIQGEDSKGIVQDVEICNNYFVNSWGAGIWLISYQDGGKQVQSIDIHHNMFLGVGQSHNIPETGGITLSGMQGTIIQNNVFDGAYNKAINNLAGTGIKVEDNIFTNTVSHSGPGQEGTGKAIYSKNSGISLVKDNCFYNNENGNTAGCKSENDDIKDPKTHLTSSGWIWNSAKNTWQCDRVEPKDLNQIIRHVEPLKPGEKAIVDNDLHEIEDIFGLRDVEVTDTGRNNQTVSKMKIKVIQDENGKVAGGVKIGGYRNLINYRNQEYISSPYDVLFNYSIIKSPSLNLYSGNIKQVDNKVNITFYKNKVSIVLTAYVSWYDLKTNFIAVKNKKPEKTIHIFRDEVNFAPKIWPELKVTEGTADEYRGPIKNYTLVRYQADNISKIVYKYNGTITTHYKMLGLRHIDNETGLQYTNFTDSDFWKGDLSNYGDSLYINGSNFDPKKLTVEAYNPYENKTVNIKYTLHTVDDKSSLDLETLLKMIIIIIGILKLLKHAGI